MPLLTELLLWLKNNDVAIKALATIAGSGGIWFWVDKFKNRIRVKIWNVRFPLDDKNVPGFQFEAENVSNSLTSFSPEFTITGYTKERKKLTSRFTFDRNERQLPSYVAKEFVGWPKDSTYSNFYFQWFIIVQFPLSRGQSVRLRFRNMELQQISFLRFQWERLLYICVGKLPNP